MRFWFSAQSEVPLYRQLATQVQLAISSGDLRPGDRLPSTREMARRFAIHPNTISAGYRELVRGGWTERRHGSGVYVCDRRPPTSADTRIDQYIAEFFLRAHELGLPSAALRARLGEWVAAPPPDHWLLVEPDEEACRILLAELRSASTREVRWSTSATCANPSDVTRAIACCRPSQERTVRAALPPGVELVTLPITSASHWLMPWTPAPSGSLIGIVSHWPEFLEKARTMLVAAGIPAEALIVCDARDPGWQRGLRQAAGILCDAYTASTAKLPRGPQIVVFPLVAESARALLEQAWL